LRVAPSGALSLEHLAIRGGLLSSGNGGGILNDGGTLHLTGSIVADNVTEKTGGGGGIASMEGTVTISRSRLSGNRAELEAGGILIFGGSLILRDSLVSHNEASITSGVVGDSSS
jgi:fibronectin-binding autotransporter adhesin